MHFRKRERASARAIFIALLVSAPSVLHAQEWNLDAQTGRIRSALDPNAPESQSAVLGIRYDDALTSFRVSGGVPTGSEQPLWGSLAAAKRLVVRNGGFFAGVDIAGNGFLMHDRVQRVREVPGPLGPKLQPGPSFSGSAFAVQALPVLGFESARVQAHARAGVSHYNASFGENSRERTVRLADAEVVVAPSARFALIPSVRHYRADDGRFTYAGLTAVAVAGPATLWGTAGQWLSHSDQAMPWAAGATLRVHDRIAISASARHDAIDPLYLAPPQTGWSAGVSILLGRKPAISAPVPARYENGRATIRLPASKARTRPSVAGDFNDWKPQPMQRDGKDWTLTIALAPGVYNYSFVTESGEWFVPQKYAGRKDDGMGGHVAVLVVQQ
ncbi:MAG: glycogen-binding domain-containing protein [Gemmatimonadota bacterium]